MQKLNRLLAALAVLYYFESNAVETITAPTSPCRFAALAGLPEILDLHNLLPSSIFHPQQGQWTLNGQIETQIGTAFILELGDYPYNDILDIIAKYPKLARSVGVFASDQGRLVLGDATWINTYIANSRFPQTFKFIDYISETPVDSIQFNQIDNNKSWLVLEAFANDTILLAADSKFWHDDRINHFLGYAYLGRFYEITWHFKWKSLFLLRVRDLLRSHSEYQTKIENILTIRANEMAHILNYASSSIQSTLAFEDIIQESLSGRGLEGLALIGGYPPETAGFHSLQGSYSLKVRVPRDYQDTKTLLQAILDDLQASQVNLHVDLLTSLTISAEDWFLPPLPLEAIQALILQRRPE